MRLNGGDCVPKGVMPVLSGEITTKNGTEYVKVGKIALWYARSKSANAPKYEGNVEVAGEKRRVALWERNVVEDEVPASRSKR